MLRPTPLAAMMPSVSTVYGSPSFAQGADQPPAARSGQSTIPYAKQKFRDNIGTTYLDSDPARFPAPATATAGAPNVLLVLLDDVGFRQFEVTGGGVSSPAMDELANEGELHTRLHTTGPCSPIRAALLTGRNHKVAGTGVVTEFAIGYDGHAGIIPKDTATFSDIPRRNGCATAWIGENHDTRIYDTSALGPFDHWPNGLGFDYFHGLMAGRHQPDPALSLREPDPVRGYAGGPETASKRNDGGLRRPGRADGREGWAGMSSGWTSPTKAATGWAGPER